MADQKQSNNFGIGVMFGALVGAVTALFLSPNTGEENRKKALEMYEKVKQMVQEGEIEEKAKELFGEVTEEGTRLIAEVRSEILTRLDEVKSDVSTFDKDKFTKYVEETVTTVGDRVKASTKQMDQLKDNIVSKFEGEVKKTEKAKKVLKPKITV
jgi:gas vesicle protein